MQLEYSTVYDGHSTTPEQHLYQAVISNAIVDIIAAYVTTNTDAQYRARKWEIRTEAVDWILNGEPAFFLYCDLAGYVAPAIQQRTKILLARLEKGEVPKGKCFTWKTKKKRLNAKR